MTGNVMFRCEPTVLNVNQSPTIAALALQEALKRWPLCDYGLGCGDLGWNVPRQKKTILQDGAPKKAKWMPIIPISRLDLW